VSVLVNSPLTPNDPYRGRAAPLTSKRCILYTSIYSTNIVTEYFKHGIKPPLILSSECSLFHNSNIFGSCIIHILYTGVLKLRNNSGAKRLRGSISINEAVSCSFDLACLPRRLHPPDIPPDEGGSLERPCTVSIPYIRSMPVFINVSPELPQ
jgi:hypothetical protein